ncbi:MAG: DJ-1/PfpI family protein [Oscillospiraceae bacterium]|nr:DJ-1/PfpI family protein [Oscillospiraceae bacterium]
MIYVFLANGFEETEAVTPIDILRRCGKEVVTVGIGGSVIKGSHGIAVVTDIEDKSVELNEKLEAVVLPGGMPGTLNLEASETVQKALDYCTANNLYIGAICAAPTILGHKGILNGKKAVCFTGFEKELAGAEVLDVPAVQDGKIITSRGAGTAIEFGLKLAEALISEECSKNMGEKLLWAKSRA